MSLSTRLKQQPFPVFYRFAPKTIQAGSEWSARWWGRKSLTEFVRSRGLSFRPGDRPRGSEHRKGGLLTLCPHRILLPIFAMFSRVKAVRSVAASTVRRPFLFLQMPPNVCPRSPSRCPHRSGGHRLSGRLWAPTQFCNSTRVA